MTEQGGPEQDGPERTAGDAGAAPAPEPGAKRRLRWMVAAGALVLIGGAVWVFNAVLGGGGPQPAEALPASVAVYLRVDLDPSAGQKIAALRLADRFPALADVADDLDDDLKRGVVDFIAGQDPDFDARFDYDRDFAPWLGDRVGIGVVVGEGPEPTPLVAVQVTDRDAATATLTELVTYIDVDEGEASGFAFSGDYVVIAPSQAAADAAVAGAEVASLADDERFQQVHAALGDPGVASLWAGGDLDDLLGGSVTAGGADAVAASSDAAAEPPLGELAMAMALRLGADHVELAGLATVDDESMEAVAGAAGAELDASAALGRLPATTLFALAFGGVELTEDQRTDLWEQAGEAAAPFDLDQLAADVAEGTGVELPDDLFDLLGNDVTLVLDTSILGADDLGEGPPDFDAALLFDLSGEAGAAAVATLVDLIEQTGIGLVVAEDAETTVVTLNQGYLDRLTGAVDVELLSDTGAAERALGAGDPVALAVFGNVAGMVEAARDDPAAPLDEDVLANLEAVEAVGLTGWADELDGGLPAGRFSLRLTLAEG